MMGKRMISLLLSLVLLAGRVGYDRQLHLVAERHRAHDLRQRQNEGL